MLFVQEQYQYLAAKFIDVEDFFVRQFENQELSLEIKPLVFGKKIVVLGSMTAPAEQALQLLLLLHTLRLHGATQVVLISPYLGYQRQDAVSAGFSCGLLWSDAMLHAAQVTQIIALEPHIFPLSQLLSIPVFGLSSELFFAEEIAYFVQLGFSFIFPDVGSVARSSWILEKFSQVPQGFFSKQRVYDMVEFQNFQGKVGKKVMIIDDILDSGQTLVQLSMILRQMGVEEIVILVTHAFFNGQIWNDLWDLGVQYIYCTNSLLKAHQITHPKIRCKDISFLLQKFL